MSPVPRYVCLLHSQQGGGEGGQEAGTDRVLHHVQCSKACPPPTFVRAGHSAMLLTFLEHCLNFSSSLFLGKTSFAFLTIIQSQPELSKSQLQHNLKNNSTKVKSWVLHDYGFAHAPPTTPPHLLVLDN